MGWFGSQAGTVRTVGVVRREAERRVYTIYVWYDTRVTDVSQFHPDFKCKSADTVVKGKRVQEKERRRKRGS